MTATLAQLQERDRAQPVYLVDIALLNGGPVLHLSDRGIPDPIGGIIYNNYLASVNGVGSSLYRATSAFNSEQVSLVFLNLPWDAYSHLSELVDAYPIEGARCTIKQVFLDDLADNAPCTPQTVFVGRCDSPFNTTEISFACYVPSEEAMQAQLNR